MEKKNLKITSINELKNVANGELVELPGFTADTTFVARLKRPSLLVMAKAGKIPNSLLSQVNVLFTGGISTSMEKSEKNNKALIDLYDVMEIICKESFVEPTYDELVENGITLTDQQIIAIFMYTQRGVKSLENFRS